MCAAALSQDVKDKPHGVEVLGEKLVLFREASGKVRVNGSFQEVCYGGSASVRQAWQWLQDMAWERSIPLQGHFDLMGFKVK